MGPRLCSRGDVIAAKYEYDWGKLQWGRGFVAAETRGDNPKCASTRGASMGPRLCSRGDLPDELPERMDSTRFNGAAAL